MLIDEYWTQFNSINLKWHYLIGSIYFLIGLLCLISNGMVLFYLIKVKNFKSRGTIFLINLAIADIFKTMCNVPMNVVSSYYGEWIFDQWGCDFYGFTGGLFGFACVCTLSFMSIERYLVVKYPLYSLKKTSGFKFTCIIFTWIYSAVMMFPELQAPNGFMLEGFLTSCSFNYLSREFESRIYMLILFIGGFLLPMITICVFNFLMFIKLKPNKNLYHHQIDYERERKMSRQLKYKYVNKFVPETGSNVDDIVLEDFNKIRQKPREKGFNNLTCSSTSVKGYLLRREMKAAKKSLVTIILFCLAWVPYAIVTLLAQFGTDIENYINPYTTSIPAVFAKFSSFYNPLIYTLSNDECKNYYKNLLVNIFKKKVPIEI